MCSKILFLEIYNLGNWDDLMQSGFGFITPCPTPTILAQSVDFVIFMQFLAILPKIYPTSQIKP